MTQRITSSTVGGGGLPKDAVVVNPKCKTRQDCLRELARVMDMVDGTEIKWQDCIKALNCTWVRSSILDFVTPTEWSFAVALVEDKPVFIGDTIWHYNYGECVVTGAIPSGYLSIEGRNSVFISPGCFSWNHPKKEPAIPEGFTRHDGGKCPVHGDTVVALFILGDGRGKKGAAEIPARLASWGETAFPDNRIIAYRVIKPATVMVELTREDAKHWSGYSKYLVGHQPSVNLYEACRKALAKEQS